MKKRTLEVLNDEGLHARPASLFCKTASRFKSSILIENLTTDSELVNAKSIMGVLTLAATKGSQIQLTVEGEDETEAIDTLSDLIRSRFAGED